MKVIEGAIYFLFTKYFLIDLVNFRIDRIFIIYLIYFVKYVVLYIKHLITGGFTIGYNFLTY